MFAVADPGFPRGRGANPRGDANIRFAKISEKLHNVEKNLYPEGGGRGRPKFYYPPLLCLDLIWFPFISYIFIDCSLHVS